MQMMWGGMRTAVKFNCRGQRAARYVRQWLAVAFSSAMAARYCLAAQDDERNGFPFTAAMEWRKAAELLGSSTPIAALCWCEWERIMRLPRRLAGPIVASNAATYASSTLDVEAITAAAVPSDPPLAA